MRSGSDSLLESNTMKLHVEGLDSESPLGFGLRNVFFSWESDNPRVLTVEHLAKTKESDIPTITLQSENSNITLYCLTLATDGSGSEGSGTRTRSRHNYRYCFACSRL